MPETPFGTMESGEGKPKAPTTADVFTDPAKYAGTQYDPVTQSVPQQKLLGEAGFIADHAEGDTWNPQHEPFHESADNVSAPTRGGQTAFLWSDFYRGAPKSALHWYRLKLRDMSGADPGPDFGKEFIAKLAPSQKRELGIT